MIAYINEHSLRLSSVYEHVEKNQISASCIIGQGEPFPDVSFMKGLRYLDSFSITDDEGVELPLVCDYNYIETFTTNFSPNNKGYSMSVGYREVSNETNSN